MNAILPVLVHGHVLIKDSTTGEILVNKDNQIHPANMAIAIARGLSNSSNFQIFKMKLGNQGTYVDSSQQIVFRPPNTTGVTADLYNQTYVETVDDANVSVGSGNSVTYTTVPSTTSTRVIVTCVIAANEANNRVTDEGDANTTDDGGLDAVDITPTEGQFFFDELGLFTAGTDETDPLNGINELMLSHLVFSPLEKTSNREITVIYSLTITVT